jgi:two-component system, response regulator
VTAPLILLVEDSPDDELLTLRALRKSGMGDGVVVARDGVEALEYLRRSPSLPGLVLLDAKLPRLDGAEVLRQIRADERMSSLFIAVLTSADAGRWAEEEHEAGADLFLSKGVDYDRFCEEMRGLRPLLAEVSAARRKRCGGPVG